VQRKSQASAVISILQDQDGAPHGVGVGLQPAEPHEIAYTVRVAVSAGTELLPAQELVATRASSASASPSSSPRGLRKTCCAGTWRGSGRPGDATAVEAVAMLRLGATDASALERLPQRCWLALWRVADGGGHSGFLLGRKRGGAGGCSSTRAGYPGAPAPLPRRAIICRSPARRAGLDRDAGGTDPEEAAAVCYLQIPRGRTRSRRAGRP
jgi:hypothetical protein